ncbi:MAG: endopeptidase La [Chloroflexi bacterium]|nr:endopeptidase La [Chloroflexota bacterium]
MKTNKHRVSPSGAEDLDWDSADALQDVYLEYPILPLREVVVFPHMVSPLFIGRERSMRTIEAASALDHPLIAVTQRDFDKENPTPEDLYAVGTEITIERILHLPDGTANVLAQGHSRVRIVDFTQTHPYLMARATLTPDDFEETLSTKALMRAVLALFEKCVELNEDLPEDAYIAALNADEPGWLADLVASIMEFDVEKRQELLETFDPTERLERLSILLASELDLLELENKIHSRVQEEVDKSQREFFLREQMRAIQNELGETDPTTSDLKDLRAQIADSAMPDIVRKKAEKELHRLEGIPPASPEGGIIRTYLGWLVDLPWAKTTEDNTDIAHAISILHANHFGLRKAKERIVEHIAVRKLAPEKMRTPILCFVGPPGTGKTSLGRSIAQALGRNFVRVSLGGVRDEAEIRGHRRTYIGALPGRIIQTMRDAGSINPLFMLDEIDKLAYDFRGDPASALLEVLDPEQNNNFADHYLDVPYDLSKVMFITTANTLYPLSPALLDRMEVIDFPGYIEEEKLQIAKRFLIPRQIEEHGVRDHGIHFSDGAINKIIREYTLEAGVRNLEREIARICRKFARKIAEGKPVPHHTTASSLGRYLGPSKVTHLVAEDHNEIGVATGVAVTESGGDILSIEVTIMEGKGNLLLTGQLGEIMQESAQAALSYTRARAEKLGIANVDFDKIDIHIHVPEGAVPKDGPSAGITIATALISALLDRPVNREVGMTGEITLRGRVLPIGGLRQKAMAAYRAGLKTFLVPTKNRKDMVDIPRKVQRDLKFVFVERMDDVLPVALVQADNHPATN